MKDDAYARAVQALDQMGTGLRQIEEWAVQHRGRMIEQGWSEEAAEQLAMERVQLMQSIIIAASVQPS